jgi:hypothetical protein
VRFSHYEPCPRCRSNSRDSRGDNFGVYADGSGHCFSCGFHKNAKFVVPLEYQRKDDHNGSKVLPYDFTREVPARGWKWLLQYGLSYRYWQPFVGWSEQDSRLVFTVGDPTEFSIGRFIDDGGEQGGSRHGNVPAGVPSEVRPQAGPLVLAPSRLPRKWFVWGESHKTAHVFRPGQGQDIRRDQTKSTRVVLVEDLISAHKVGQYQTCIPLFGTKVFDACVPVLRHLGLPITIWLDADQQGTVQRKAANLSILTGLPTSYVFTDKDPKSCSFEQIEETLK